MDNVKFKISLTRCKKNGLYNIHSSFLDLEKNLQAKSKYKLYLNELRNNKNIDQYREWVHENKSYERTSISICFNLPKTTINKYALQDKNNKKGKQLFQEEHIFTPGYSIKKNKGEKRKNQKKSRMEKSAESKTPINGNKEISSIQSTLIEDLKDLDKKKIDTTTKDTLVSARIGQGVFRTQVLQLWNNRCCVTGSTAIDAIRASHIKPWRHSNDEERLDPHNGLSLVASLDALFDAGLISFESSGALIISPSFPEKEWSIFQLESRLLTKAPDKATAEYLTYHRKQVFRK